LSAATQALRDKVTWCWTRKSTPPTRNAGSARSRCTTTDGRTLHGRVDEPKGDPGNTLSRDEITAKALRLAAWSGGANRCQDDSRRWQAVTERPRLCQAHEPRMTP
jgi:2-methylcitrate dehydratase PrpD